MGAPRGVPGPRTFCLKRRPVRAAFSRCLVSELASGQPSTEPILQRWSPTASRQPQYAVPHAAGFLGVGVCYESIASEKNAPASLSKRPRNKHLKDMVQLTRGGFAPEGSGPPPQRSHSDPVHPVHLARWSPSECQWPVVPCAFRGRVAPPHLQPPLISPPTNLRGRARDSRLGAPNSNPAKFILVRFAKNATHATKTKNRYVRLFYNLVSEYSPGRGLSIGIPWTSHRCLWREESRF